MADPQGQYKLSDIAAPGSQPAPGKGQYSLLDVDPYPAGAPNPASLPTITNEDLQRWGRTALDYLPAAAATIGAIAAPVALPAAAPFLAATGGAAVAGAAGEGARQAVLAATGAKGAPSSFGDAALKTLETGGEQGALEAGGRVVSAPFEWALGRLFSPERLYQSALKPSGLAGPEEQAAVVKSGLEGIPGPVPAAPLKIGDAAYHENRLRMAAVNKQIGDVVNTHPPMAPYLIDPLDVASRLDDLKAGSFGQQALNKQDLKAIDQAKREYLEKHGAVFDANGNMTRRPMMMTGATAQAEKVATYQQLGEGKYGEMQRAQEESAKALAAGLREKLGEIYPELKDLNPQDASMIRLDGALRAYVARNGNRNLVPLMKSGIIAIAGTGGALAHGEVGSIAGALTMGGLMALDDPGVKSAMAIALKTRAARLAFKGAQEALPVTGRVLTTATQQPQQ